MLRVSNAPVWSLTIGVEGDYDIIFSPWLFADNGDGFINILPLVGDQTAALTGCGFGFSIGEGTPTRANFFLV